MSSHGRTYPSAAEKLRRFEAYRRNVDLIDASNRDAERLGYELGENEFTDLTNEEFMTRYIGGAGAGGGLITTLAGDVVEGVVSSKNTIEGGGCCWAFAAAATVESLNKINGGELVDLSVQELVDCSTGVFSSPCGYGWPKSALQWIKSKGGLLTEAEYPYVAKRGRCTVHDAARRIGKITGVQDVQPGSNEDALALAVLRTPVTVQIDGSGSVLQNYKSGVYKGPCATSQNHVVTVVGYGVTGAGEEYWIAKNSWGQTWGQKGFFFMRRGADGPRGLCGMAMYGAYPVM
ncbi:papain-like cysteine proteinase [Hordeum vulgare]|nr:papain-like cysteine proteinase [Hordeum vulgare]